MRCLIALLLIIASVSHAEVEVVKLPSLEIETGKYFRLNGTNYLTMPAGGGGGGSGTLTGLVTGAGSASSLTVSNNGTDQAIVHLDDSSYLTAEVNYSAGDTLPAVDGGAVTNLPAGGSGGDVNLASNNVFTGRQTIRQTNDFPNVSSLGIEAGHYNASYAGTSSVFATFTPIGATAPIGGISGLKGKIASSDKGIDIGTHPASDLSGTGGLRSYSEYEGQDQFGAALRLVEYSDSPYASLAIIDAKTQTTNTSLAFPRAWAWFANEFAINFDSMDWDTVFRSDNVGQEAGWEGDSTPTFHINADVSAGTGYTSGNADFTHWSRTSSRWLQKNDGATTSLNINASAIVADARLNVQGAIALGNITFTPTTYASGGMLFAQTNEIYTMDGAGNVTLQSSHREDIPVNRSWNVYTGEGQEIDMLVLVNLMTNTSPLEVLQAKSNLITQISVPKRRWHEDQEQTRLERMAQITDWDIHRQAVISNRFYMITRGAETNNLPIIPVIAERPQPYQPKSEPEFITRATNSPPMGVVR